MAITLVQGPARGTGTTSPISVTMASAPIQGNVLIATVTGYTQGSGIGIIAITQVGVTWSKAISWYPTNNNGAEIWRGIVGAGASASISVDIGVPTYGDIVNICEWSGLATVNPVDQTAKNDDGTVPSSPSDTGTTPTTTQDNELWIGCIAAVLGGTDQSAPTNGFTLLDGCGASLSNGYLYKIVTSTGTANSGTTTSGPASYWVGCVATFYAGEKGTLQLTHVKYLKRGIGAP